MIVRRILLLMCNLIMCVSPERWSRQITNIGRVRPEDINDWVPLTHAVNNDNNDGAKVARVLSFPDNQFLQAIFNSNPPPSPSSAPASTVQSPPPLFRLDPQQPATAVEQVDQYHQRYVVPINDQPTSQNNIETLQHHYLQPQQQPTSQSFFKFEMPSFNKDKSKPNNLPTVQTGYQIQHSFSSLYNQKPVLPTDFHPQFQPLINQNIFRQNTKTNNREEYKEKKQEIKTTRLPEVSTSQPPTAFPLDTNFQLHRPTSFHVKSPFQNQEQLATSLPHEKEIQLLYVPYDTLYRPRNEPVMSNNKHNAIPQHINPTQINNFYTQDSLSNPNPKLYTPTPTTTTLTTFKPSTTFNAFLNPRFTSPKPKTKLKPHQPPLAMFALKITNQGIPVNDALKMLINAKSITVLDALIQTTPQVFIGPTTLPTPYGYNKFELPYLSSIGSHSLETRLQELPFFVAPLSYKTPLGFHKIILPEPHVGSVIVNKPFPVTEVNNIEQEPSTSTHRSTQTNKQIYITPSTNQYNSEVSTSTNDYFNNGQYRIISSPKPPVINSHRDTNRQYYHKTQNENYQIENITLQSYTNSKPLPNHVVNEEYFKVNPTTLSSVSTTAATSISATENSKQHFAEATSPSQTFEKETAKLNQIINNISSPIPNKNQQRYNAKVNQHSALVSDEENRMKTYYREQGAFKSHPYPQTQNTDYRDKVYSNLQYTSIPVDYNHQKYSLPPSSTSSYYEASTLKTTTPKERITFYGFSSQSPESEDIKRPDEPLQYIHDENNYSSKTQNPERVTVYQRYHNKTENNNIPSNHRPTYSNEVAHNYEKQNEEEEQEIEYKPNPYKLPTELPPLTPNLPGLVNALIEKDRLNAIEKENSTTENSATTSLMYYQPTRKPSHRVKKPVTKISSSTSVSYSSSSDTSRRTVNRGRRPYNPRNNVKTTSSTSSLSSETTSTTAKSPTIRNPNRVRYNPTPEERRRYRPRVRTSSPVTSTKSSGRDEEDNLDYQRDVLKQNYPVFKPGSRKVITTTSSTTERTTESQTAITVTPSNDKNEFASYLEPTQIIHEYQKSPNYGPGYFPNAEETLQTEPNELEKDEIPAIQTVTSTTTEQIKETTRRPVFIRRLSSRPVRTTTEVSQTTVASEERYTVRPRTRPSNGQHTRVVKIRSRIRKPHPASTTTSPEKKTQNVGYHELNRFNQDFFQNDQTDKVLVKNNQKDDYNINAAESKWSPSLSHANSFRPLNPDDRAKFLKENKQFNNEPEIVTAGPDYDENKQQNYPNIYLFNVSAGFDSSNAKLDSKKLTTSNSTETSEVSADLTLDDNCNNQSKKCQKSKNQNEKERKIIPIRRNQIKLRPTDALETAESQNLGNQLYNLFSIYNQRNKYWNEKNTFVNDFSNEQITNHGKQEDHEKENSESKYRSNMDDHDKVTTVTTSNDPYSETERTKIQAKSEDKTVSSASNLKESMAKNIQSIKNTHTFDTTLPPILTTDSGRNEDNEKEKEDMNTDSSTTDNSNYDYNDNTVTDVTTIITQTNTNEKDDTDPYTKNITNNSSTNIDNEDLDSQPSLFDEVRKKLSNLFPINDDDNDDDDDLSLIKSNFRPRKQEYINIQRIRAVTDTIDKTKSHDHDNNDNENDENNKNLENNNKSNDDNNYRTIDKLTKTSPFHKDLMKNVVYATSTSKEISHETEICYRGRCVKATK